VIVFTLLRAKTYAARDVESTSNACAPQRRLKVLLPGFSR
jgi:hypothetical protein